MSIAEDGAGERLRQRAESLRTEAKTNRSNDTYPLRRLPEAGQDKDCLQALAIPKSQPAPLRSLKRRAHEGPQRAQGAIIPWDRAGMEGHDYCEEHPETT